MSPLADRADRLHRPVVIGHIRLGIYEGRPKATDTFVFSSPDQHFLRPLAAQYGGDVLPYEPQGGLSGDRWRLISGSDSIVVLLPFERWDDNLVQFYELHGAGGLKRRCTGIDATTYEVDEYTGDVSKDEVACLCADLAERECATVSRLRCWLPQSGLGVWECRTTSKTASYDLEDEMWLLESAFTGQLNRIPVRLTYRPRTIHYRDKDGKRKRTTKRIISVSLAQAVTEVLAGLGTDRPLEAAVRGALGPASKESLALPSPPGSAVVGDDAGGGDGEPGAPGAGRTSPPADVTPWDRFSAALSEAIRLFGATSARQRVRFLCTERQQSPPVKADWPEETLLELARALEQQLDAARQMSLEGAS